MKKLHLQVTLMALVLFSLTVQAQKSDRLNVAVFLYEGMELLDFAGPTEVFAATQGFTVYSISVDGKPLECNATGKILNKITPDYSMDDAPQPDVVIFPGGGSGPISKNENVLSWVKKLEAQGTFLMSVCTGASILTNTGLLKGKNITTWHGFIPALQAAHPDLTVLENTRFVDNGTILTTAGVSAGIDGALYLVSKIKGRDVAKATAKYMEFDKWDPTQGRVDVRNDLIVHLEQTSWDLEKIMSTMPKEKLPYEGELKNAAFDLASKKKYQEALVMLDAGQKLYPKSKSVRVEIGNVNRAFGKPAPSIQNEERIVSMINNGQTKEAFALVDKELTAFPGMIPIYHGRELTHLGISFYEKKDLQTSLKIFEVIARSDPQYGSYYNVGEIQANLGNIKESIANYRKSLEYKPGDAEVTKIIADLETKL